MVSLAFLLLLLLGTASAGSFNASLEPDLTWSWDNATGTFSGLAPITLTALNTFFGQPNDTIAQYAWAYPDPAYRTTTATDVETSFKRTGGFVYFTKKGELVGVTTVKLSKPAGASFVINFGAQMAGDAACPRWSLITLGSTTFPNATAYCWEPGTATTRGSFHYNISNSSGPQYISFRVTATALESVPGFPDGLGPFYLVNTGVASQVPLPAPSPSPESTSGSVLSQCTWPAMLLAMAAYFFV